VADEPRLPVPIEAARLYERVIGVAVLALLILLFLQILQPFIGPLLWATTLSVAVWPLYVRMRRWLGGRSGPAALIMCLVMLVVLVTPIALLSTSLAEQIAAVTRLTRDLGSMGPPPPPAWLDNVPVVGPSLHARWLETIDNSQAFLAQLRPYARTVGGWLLAQSAQIGLSVLQLLLAVVIAGILLAGGETITDYLRRFARRVGNERTPALVDLAGSTIRGVVTGVVGTALVQAAILTAAFLLAPVPGAALLGMLAFLIAILQLPVLLLAIAVAAWLVYQGLTSWAIFVGLAGLVAGTVDNVLRPYLIKQSGTHLPIVLIFLGVLGGLIAYGPIGLFFGSVVVALVHRLLREWLSDESEPPT
jgi:predicted PurR-regulated permease PerM